MKIKLPDAKKRQQIFYFALKIFSYICAAVALISLIYIIFFIFYRGGRYVTFDFIFGEYKDTPTLRPALQGTLMLIAVSLGITVPIGIFTAIFLTEYTINPRLVRWIRVAAETLAGIPSIVYGLFGYVLFVVILGWGYSMLAGGLTLSIMILPTMIRTTEEALLAVPMAYREASFAMGASKIRTIFKIVLPCSIGGIVTAIILAMGRVISESAVLLLTIGCIVEFTPALMGPGTSLALNVYYFGNIGYPKEAAATAVVLIVMVLLINLLATLLGKLLSRGKHGNN